MSNKIVQGLYTIKCEINSQGLCIIKSETKS